MLSYRTDDKCVHCDNYIKIVLTGGKCRERKEMVVSCDTCDKYERTKERIEVDD